MKKLNITLLLLGLTFLVYLVWKIGPGDLWHQVRALGWGFILIVLAEGLANLAHTAGLQHCLAASPPRVPLGRLFLVAMAGYSINYLTPTASVGGEASKVALLAESHSPSEVAGSVMVDKLTTGLAHLLLVGLGALVLLEQGTLPVGWWSVLFAFTSLLAGGMGVFLVLQRKGKIGGVLRWMAGRGLGGKAMRQAAAQVSSVDDTLSRFHRERPRDLRMSVAWHFLGHSAAFVHVWIFLLVAGYPTPIATVATAGFLSLWCDLLTFALPLNLGALEGSRVLALRAVGDSAALGLTLGLAIRLAQLAWACFGLACYFRLTVRRSQRPAPGPTATSTATVKSPLAEGTTDF